jgi:hypothetical protein
MIKGGGMIIHLDYQQQRYTLYHPFSGREAWSQSRERGGREKMYREEASAGEGKKGGKKKRKERKRKERKKKKIGNRLSIFKNYDS